ncbi:hypothetical protein WBG99_02160 [Streptomyces sp. TG1A-60]|uniref:hypothetical protein n=1 Tax=Streptomyces sp. TG1A-60 TaxID=3129111 RepID=UPI0030CF1E3E
MVTRGANSGGVPDDGDGGPSIPEEVWQRFLSDSDPAIRASAPREPSARERALGQSSPPTDADEMARRARRPYSPAPQEETEAVGELWHPEEAWTRRAWRGLDGRARSRRVCRAIGTAAAITLALAAWSLLSTRAGTSPDGPSDTTVQRLESTPQADRLPDPDPANGPWP